MVKKRFDLKQAVVLAGGRGERLRPLTDNIPKPMAPVNGVPFLDYLLNTLVAAGIKKILLLVGYRSEVIKNRYGYSLNNGVKIEYSTGTVEDMTGRRIVRAYEKLDDNFLLLYGDNYWPIEMNEMIELYIRNNVKVSTTVFSNKNGTAEYGKENNVEVDNGGIVRRYDKSRKSSRMNGVDMGYFIVNKQAIDHSIEGNVSFEQDMLPPLIAGRQLAAYITDRQYYYITDMESLKRFENVLAEEGFKPIPETLLKMGEAI